VVGFLFSGEALMGFQRKRKVYKLDFEGTEWDGLVVTVRGLTTGEYLDFVSVTAMAESDENQTGGMVEMLADHLVSWNLEEDGVPVPCNLDGVRANELPMNMAIVRAWTEAMSGVPEETEKKSVTGDAPLLESIPTESL
jgi:hypothetical protein